MNEQVEKAEFYTKLQEYAYTHGRNKLIKDARIATETFQTILEKKFPWGDGQDSMSRRQIRAWVRTLTRIAVLLSLEPKSVCTSLGLILNSDVESALNFELRKADEVGMRKAAQAGTLTTITKRQKVSVGIVVLPHYLSEMLEGFAQILAGTFSPFGRVTITSNITPETALEGLQYSPALPQYDIILGLPDMVQLMTEGVDFVSVPGWKFKLAALWWRGTGGTVCPTEGSILESSDTPRQPMFVANKLYAKYLRSWHAPEFITSYDADTPEAAVEMFQRSAKLHIGRPVVLISPRFRCGEVMRRSSEYGLADSLMLVETSDLPSFDFSVAMRCGDERFKYILQTSVAEALQNSWSRIASLYAKAIATSYESLNGPTICGWPAESFTLGDRTELFWKRFLEELTQCLFMQEVIRCKGTPGTNAREEAARIAAGLMPQQPEQT
ncbi:MAG: hypothetical protein EXS51_01475 [Candidatus Taylorbacteria bacterium]|nr:hypothetical protein [Candidatus Taylorbacteria bacterium]